MCGGRRIGLAVGLLLLAVGGWGWYWAWPRTVATRGGLYFPWAVQLKVPLFRQGDPRWGQDRLGDTDETLHASGCAVTSAAMVLASYGADINPGQLNRFLKKHGGYTPQGWLYWEKAAEFAPGLAEKAYEAAPSYAWIDWNLLRGNPVIVRVPLPGSKHFVVIAGKRGWEYLIRNPGGRGSDALTRLSGVAPKMEALRFYRKLRVGG
jgi:hypothetical protein